MSNLNRNTSDKQIDELYQAYINGEIGGGGSTPAGDIAISSQPNNVLTKKQDGYHALGFVISNEDQNAIVKKQDGYFVKKETDIAHTSDITDVNNKIDNEVTTINNNITLISNKIEEISSNNTKVKEVVFEDTVSENTLVTEVDSLLTEVDYVILNVRILVQNKSVSDELIIKITEHDLQTMSTKLVETEIQQYDLGNESTIKIYAEGDYKIYVRITYI